MITEKTFIYKDWKINVIKSSRKQNKNFKDKIQERKEENLKTGLRHPRAKKQKLQKYMGKIIIKCYRKMPQN